MDSDLNYLKYSTIHVVKISTIVATILNEVMWISCWNAYGPVRIDLDFICGETFDIVLRDVSILVDNTLCDCHSVLSEGHAAVKILLIHTTFF